MRPDRADRPMHRIRSLAVALLSAAIASMPTAGSPAAEPFLLGYQRPDGAITVLLHGDTVDPYFAAKALISAEDAHADVQDAALKWIAWLLPRQNAQGNFDRFCVRNGNATPCAAADADDAAIALWIELLARHSPGPTMPAAWQSSLDKAVGYLQRLRDNRKGVYQVSPTLPVALLMDNVEVYDAMQALAAYYSNAGDAARARQWSIRAQRLSDDIKRVFWSSGQYQPSTQHLSDQAFYPSAVAPIFPLLSGIGIPGQSSSAFYGTWMKNYCDAWLKLPQSDYPWGLVALASQKLGDRAAVSCWHAHAAPFRHGAHWNVLEEALFTTFEAQMADPLAPAQCCQPFAPTSAQ